MPENYTLKYPGAQIDSLLDKIANLEGPIKSNTTAGWNSQVTLISEKGVLYIYTDYQTIDGVDIAAVKIGDGNAYLIDLPFFASGVITEAERQKWNNKVSVYIAALDPENLRFTTD